MINFSELETEFKFGEFTKINASKSIANAIHTSTSDIGLDDVARKIYYSEGEIEIPAEYVEAIVAILQDPRCNLLASVKVAAIKALRSQ